MRRARVRFFYAWSLCVGACVSGVPPLFGGGVL